MRSLFSIFVACCIGLSLPSDAEGFRVVAFYYGNYDLAHISFTKDCANFFPGQQAANGFTYEATTNWSNLNDNFLSTVDVVLFLDGQPWDTNQRAAFRRFTERGGGFIGFHVSAFTSDASEWDWYHNTFLGSGNFYGNTWRPTSAVLLNEGGTHPVTMNLPRIFATEPNEWYSWSKDLRQNPDIQILLSIDQSSFPVGTGPNEWEIWHGGYYPVVWTNKNFKMLYVNMGHNDMAYEDGSNRELSHTWENPTQNRFIIDALKWAAGQPTTATAIQEEQRNPIFRVLSRHL